MAAFGAPPAAIERTFTDVADRYSEPARRYHTLDHIDAVLTTIDELAESEPSEERRALGLAGWLHDVIYDPTRPDNEAASARYAHDRLAALGLPDEIAVEAARLIELTAGHVVRDDDVDGRILVDADLAILGAPAAVYDDYAAAIRTEYRHVPDDAYRAGRAAVLGMFLDRPRLFMTGTAHARFDAAARQNLQRERDRLGTATARPDDPA